MIHPSKLCKSVVCIYDNKWVLLDGKTQVPRAGTLCTADVRYGIGVNTSTNPHLQVDSFPKAYQASSITPGCQSAGREPEQIPTLSTAQRGVRRAETARASFHRLTIAPHPAHCQQGWMAKIWPHASCCHSIQWWWQAIKGLHHVPVEQQLHEPGWGQPGQERLETEPKRRYPTQHTAQWSSEENFGVLFTPWRTSVWMSDEGTWEEWLFFKFFQQKLSPKQPWSLVLSLAKETEGWKSPLSPSTSTSPQVPCQPSLQAHFQHHPAALGEVNRLMPRAAPFPHVSSLHLLSWSHSKVTEVSLSYRQSKNTKLYV